MAEEELPEIAMPEGLDDIDNQWEDEDFEELDAEVPQENAASLAEHTAEQTKPEALAEADDTMKAGTSAEDVEAAILAETARQMAKESVEKEAAENTVPARPRSYRSHRLSTVRITLQRSAQIPGD